MIEPVGDEIEIIKQYIVDDFDVKYLKLKQYVEMVLDENKNHNLIGKNTVNNIWSRHVIDSLQLVDFIENEDLIIDLGSGSGFPAIVLAIATNKKVVLIEKSSVKAEFLQNVANVLKLNAEVKNETLTTQNFANFLSGNCVITSRAFKSVNEILWLINCNKNVSKIILLKGKTWDEEIKKAKKNIQDKWDYDVKKSILGEGVVLELNRKNYTKKY